MTNDDKLVEALGAINSTLTRIAHRLDKWDDDYAIERERLRVIAEGITSISDNGINTFEQNTINVDDFIGNADG